MTTSKPEIMAYATHHDDPLLFPIKKEAVMYCDDGEELMALIRIADYERLQTEYEQLVSYTKNGIECFANPCPEHSGINTPPFSEFQKRYGRLCLMCVVDERDALRAECEELRTALSEARANDLSAMGYLSQIRQLVGGDDFPDMVEKVKELRSKLDAHKAARIAYASEFPLGADGMPDVGSIHENIRLLKKDAEFGRSVLEAVREIVGGESFPEMIGRVKELQIERNGYKLAFKEWLEKSEKVEENRE